MHQPVRHTPTRHRLPKDRYGVVHQFAIASFDVHLRVGLFDDGMPGEIFVDISKSGSTLSGLMDAFATAVSLALQYGVPLGVLADKFIGARFEPMGFTGFEAIPEAASIVDYLFRWLVLRFDTSVTPSAANAPAAEFPSLVDPAVDVAGKGE